jgi:hypothetical protein
VDRAFGDVKRTIHEITRTTTNKTRREIRVVTTSHSPQPLGWVSRRLEMKQPF